MIYLTAVKISKFSKEGGKQSSPIFSSVMEIPIREALNRNYLFLIRFGEGLRIATDRLDSKNFYAFNPGF